MKIQLPNPIDFLDREELFFDQLELCIFHAKKAWQKIRNQKKYTEGNDYPWILFSHDEIVEKALQELRDAEGNLVDPDTKKLQALSISINEL